MAKILPFKAVRPSAEYADIIPCLPYDVFSRKEAKEYVEKHPHSFLEIDRPETAFGPDFDMYSEESYNTAKNLLEKWRKEGSFIQEEKACYYIYELIMDGRSQIGIVGCSSIDDYNNQIIKKHENTRADKEVDRIKHVDTCNAQTGPIFLAYRNNQIINDITAKYMQNSPVYDLKGEDGVVHRVWIIDGDDDNAIICKAFSDINSIYIADGHHRCASAVKVGMKRRQENPNFTGDEEFNYFLSVLFPDEQLYIMDYNRVVKDLNGHTVQSFMDEIAKYFMIGTPSYKEIHPTKKNETAMYIDGLWYLLTMKNKVINDDPVKGLDVSILQDYVLDGILGIKDPKTDERISFVGGIRGLKELSDMVNAGAAVAFAMYPTSINELFAVADAGLLMPPKSTWFEPKLRSGFFIHDISE